MLTLMKVTYSHTVYERMSVVTIIVQTVVSHRMVYIPLYMPLYNFYEIVFFFFFFFEQIYNDDNFRGLAIKYLKW